ncbi:MAG TPA: hypothetical protein V6D47_08915 [Oscillatoriaceae cyanobacterium]
MADEHDEYYEDEEYEEEEEEDFPEPAKGKKNKPKGKVSPVMIAGAALGAVLVAGAAMYFLMPDTLAAILPGPLAAMLPNAQPTPDAPPPMPVHHRPHHPMHPVAKAPDDGWQKPVAIAQAGGKHAAGKPAGDQAPDAAGMPKAPAPKHAMMPKHHGPAAHMAAHPHAVAHAAMDGAPIFATAVAFAPHSYWVAASEVEKLWKLSSSASSHQQGHFVVTGHAGRAADEAALLQKRTAKLAEMLRRDDAPLGSGVQVKTGAPAHSVTGWCDVAFVKSL